MTAAGIDVRLAVAETNIASNRSSIKTLRDDYELDVKEIRKSQRAIQGWFIGICLSLCTSSILLAVNLAIR